MTATEQTTMEQTILRDDGDKWMSMVKEPVLSTRRCYLVIIVESTEDWGRGNEAPPYKFHAEIVAVSPQWISNKSLASIAESYSMDVKAFKQQPIEAQVEQVLDYGTRATLWMETSDDEDALKAKANEQVQVCHMMFGFYMDRQQNAIGDTGWDWIKGKLGAAMRRRAKGE